MTWPPDAARTEPWPELPATPAARSCSVLIGVGAGLPVPSTAYSA